jgi:membrane protease YdiL (CAAX protease family)
MSKKLLLTAILFVLGFAGVLSSLTMEIILPPEVAAELEAQFSPTQIKFLMLVNPSIFLIAALAMGAFLKEHTTLKSPLLEQLIKRDQRLAIFPILYHGLIGGILAGLLMVGTATAFAPFLTNEFAELDKMVNPGLLARFLFGGITEEILLRYGLMTLFVWIGIKVFGKEKVAPYWIGIALSSILFAIGHFPVVFQTLGNPPPLLLTYILIGNSIGGFIFGWLYWKKGLEAAFIAHIFTHVVIVSIEFFTS